MSTSPPSSDAPWITCPECHTPMPPEKTLCERCQIKTDFEEGKDLARTGDFDQALLRFKNVCKWDEASADMKSDAYYYSGSIFLKQGNEAKAEAAWRKCFQTNPGHPKAKSKLARLIMRKPKKQWTDEDRLIVEGSDLEKGKVLSEDGPTQASASSIRWIIAVVAITLILIVGTFASRLVIKYFTFDRHIEQVELLANTGQLGRSLQYFNDNFRQGGSAHSREDAQKVLAPFFKELGKKRANEGNLEESEKILKVAAEFAPDDLEIQRELQKVKSKLR